MIYMVVMTVLGVIAAMCAVIMFVSDRTWLGVIAVPAGLACAVMGLVHDGWWSGWWGMGMLFVAFGCAVVDHFVGVIRKYRRARVPTVIQKDRKKSGRQEKGTWRSTRAGGGDPAADIACPDCGKIAKVRAVTVSRVGAVPFRCVAHYCGVKHRLLLKDWNPDRK